MLRPDMSYVDQRSSFLGRSYASLRNMPAWLFEKGGREVKGRVEGQLVLNGTTQMLNAALA